MISKLQYISQGETPEIHLENIQKACVAGANWVQLRLKNRDAEIILETAQKAREITISFKVKLIINDHYKIAKIVKADGVHLGKNDECPLVARAYLGASFIVGGTANTLEDCNSLLDKKVDYIGLGPYQFTKTKKKLSPVLGLAGYRELVTTLQTETPIIAIGGIALEDVSEIINTGVYGIAVSGAVTNNAASITEFKEILKCKSITV
ncbi:thiamine phosphate synthase [Polaribacter sp. IC073]|uniref:thiamine phosphate synthase n=1 Tax=Polaribacter sp. IC073 TaxID=2508540 RepID=UPI0011BE92CA|nr:thiamine phosphate synthase [Polaribacter sp. IC073]TXD48434.1 thiamine phosphate synthase [Polaribacter sp. IC073]